MREELVDFGLGVGLNTKNHIGEIFLGIHTIRDARRHEGLEHGQILPSNIVTDEKIVVSSKRDQSEVALADIVVQADFRIRKKQRHGGPVVNEIANGFADRTFG